MTDLLDVEKLRRDSLDGFREAAKTFFAANPDCQSMVLAVSQYFADEAGDAVHEHYFSFPTREPWWPHRCDDETEDPPKDGSRCYRCHDSDFPYGTLDSNTDAVYAWSAFCAEYGGGEGSNSLMDPIAVARRGEGGEVELELVHELVRPWMDTNRVASMREEEMWDDDDPPAPKPEPVRPAWTSDERRLVDAVLANPVDDGPRRVLVDYWLERGDVRGEFGALSFGELTNTADRRRRDQLADEHGRTWLGPLQPFISLAGARFARGPFVDQATVWVSEEAETPPDDVEEWALVRELRFAGERHYVSRHMRGLKRVFGVNTTTLLAMASAGLEAPIDTVGLSEMVGSGAWAPVKALRNVRHLLLDLQGGDAAFLAQLPPWSQLESVEVWLAANDDGYEGPRAWSDNRGADVIAALRPKLSAATRLTVGYAHSNGLRGGVVAVATREAVELADRRFAGPEARNAATAVLQQLNGEPLPPPKSRPEPAVAEKPEKRGGLFARLMKTFGR